MIEIKQAGTNHILYRTESENLIGADLAHHNYDRGVFAKQDMRGVLLINVTLRGADLSATDLNNAIITQAFMHKASFAEADLSNANFRRSDFTDVVLTGATMYSTAFVECRNLHKAIGLDQIKHSGRCAVDAETLRESVTHMPDIFLRGIGYTNEEIENLRAMYATGIRLFSCFISYRHTDKDFVLRLHSDLEAANVPCWIDAYDMQGGKYWQPQLHAAIKAHDKLLLVCSEQAILRQNVVDEIIAAIEVEREQKIQKLFPLRLDAFILSEEMLRIADRKMEEGEWRLDWVRHVRAFHIPDFSQWESYSIYKQEFDKLLRDLKNPQQRQ